MTPPVLWDVANALDTTEAVTRARQAVEDARAVALDELAPADVRREAVDYLAGRLLSVVAAAGMLPLALLETVSS